MSSRFKVMFIINLIPLSLDLENLLFMLSSISIVMGVTSLHSRLVLGRDSNKELSSIRAKSTFKGCEQSVVD